MADQLVVQMKKICQFAHLKTIACGNHDRIITLLEFLDDRSKKWNVGELSKSIQIFPLARAAGHLSIFAGVGPGVNA